MLPREFYLREPEEMARALLGKVLRHKGCAGIIVETEAYLAQDDGASHFSRGITPRTRVIFGPPGHAYVYFIYGMYDCFNVVCAPEGVGGAVLVRAIEPCEGIATMRRRRPKARRDEELANGPGKLTLAMGIRIGHNGADLTKGPITISEPDEERSFKIGVSPRIGIRKSVELPLRFFIEGNRYVSGR